MVTRGSGAADDIHHLRDGLLNSPTQFGWVKMDDSTAPGSPGKGTPRVNGGDELMTLDTQGSRSEAAMVEAPGRYRVYKIRWFGLVQLVLLNIIVSWDVSSMMHLL
jgi:hypothetical protein